MPNSPEERKHELLAWLDLPTAREQRRYLESHCHLVDVQSEIILHEIVTQVPERKHQVRDALMLLRDACARGGTIQATHEAYINLYGGFVLDLPGWLEKVEQHLTAMHKKMLPEETAGPRIVLLQEALEQAQRESASAPELLATLHSELADAWLKHPLTDHSQALETVITACEEVLQVYTVIRYPHQYAFTHINLGAAYQDRIVGKRRENLELALACYHQALLVYVRDDFPFDYAKVQHNLGIVYRMRIEGERRENLELALACLEEVKQVWTLSGFPFYYARAQSNLGTLYGERIMGKRRENLERAIACFEEALVVYSPVSFAFQYALVQNNFGAAYYARIEGNRQENLKQAIACYHNALLVRTRTTFPFDYALTQHNLGEAYRDLTVGDRSKNLVQAMSCFQEALCIRTRDAFPFQYALTQLHLGQTYTQFLIGEQQKNLEEALACYQNALSISPLGAHPENFRIIQLSIAEAETQRDNWRNVCKAYTAALQAEGLLIVLGAGTVGRDAILKEGRDAAIRLGYALSRLGRISEAVVAMERGRAQGLAEAMVLDAADPALITDKARRKRYITARTTLINAQADLHTSTLQDLDEDTRRQEDLVHTTTYRQAKATFDALVTEIRESHDPADFLNASIDAATILYIAEGIRPRHALVYLAATPWGGVAVAAVSGSSQGHFITRALPKLTEVFVNTLIETPLRDDPERQIGGFVLAQMGKSFERVVQQWGGETFQAKINALRTACRKTKQKSTMVLAAQEMMKHRLFARLAKAPLAALSKEERGQLRAKFDQMVLQRELPLVLAPLRDCLMQPLITWVCQERAASLTLIPCGYLAILPLANVILNDGRLVGKTIPTSIAPSARALLSDGRPRDCLAGVCVLGNPGGNLKWSEAEASKLAALARRLELPTEVHIKDQATRERLLSALSIRWMVDVSCHALFNQEEFLRSALHLANDEKITMAEMINHQADLRGLRLLLLSACQTAQIDLDGARDEVHSLAAAMVQAGAQAVLAAHWAVDDESTYLLMVRFFQEWLPHKGQESPAAALARAQSWLHTVTNAELNAWGRELKRATSIPHRFMKDEAQDTICYRAEQGDPLTCPYADPYYWAGFQVIGW